MRRVAAFCVLILIVGCEPSTTGSTTTAPAPTTSSDPSATTVTTLPPTSTTVTTTTVFPPMDFECPPVLVVGDGLTAIDADCSVTDLGYEGSVSDDSIPLVMDDLAGGLLYQTDGTAIFWLEPGADQAVPLVTVDHLEAESVRIEDVVTIDGEDELWFTRWRDLDWENVGDTSMVQTLERVGVGAGEPTEVANVGGYETGSSITVGGETIGMEQSTGTFYYFEVIDFEMERLPQPWNFFDHDEAKAWNCEECPTSLVVSDDGRRAIFLSPLVEDAIKFPDLVAVDLESGGELARLEVSGFAWPFSSPAEGPEITVIDILGDLVLINGADEGQPFPAIWTDLGADEPVWAALPVPGSARFLRSEVRLGELDATDLPWSAG